MSEKGKGQKGDDRTCCQYFILSPGPPAGGGEGVGRRVSQWGSVPGARARRELPGEMRRGGGGGGDSGKRGVNWHAPGRGGVTKRAKSLVQAKQMGSASSAGNRTRVCTVLMPIGRVLFYH